MRKIVRGAFASAALMLATAAGAQQQQPQTSDGPEILVTGTRDLPDQIRDFVGALTEAPVRGQLGRFEWAVCPVALGFQPAQKQAVERRLRSLAEAVGLRVGRANCRANMLVIATADKRAFLQSVWARHRRFLGGMSASEYRRLLAEPGPAAAWQQVGRLAADGTELSDDSDSGVAINRTFTAPSRITGGARPHYEAAAVVIEGRALEGLTTTQVADYAAMRLFARTDPSRLTGSAPSTILTVLEAPMGSEVPLTMTRWDLGFLRGLYGSANNTYAPAQRGEIGRTVAEELRRSDGPGR